MNARQIGTFRGIPVRLHWGAVALAILLGLLVANGVLPQLAPDLSDTSYLLGGFFAGAALLGSIFVHEASHAVVAQRHGVEVSSITLWLLGGVAHLEDEAPSPRAEAQIAGAGPVSSVAVAVWLLGAPWAGSRNRAGAGAPAGDRWRPPGVQAGRARHRVTRGRRRASAGSA